MTIGSILTEVGEVFFFATAFFLRGKIMCRSAISDLEDGRSLPLCVGGGVLLKRESRVRTSSLCTIP